MGRYIHVACLPAASCSNSGRLTAQQTSGGTILANSATAIRDRPGAL